MGVRISWSRPKEILKKSEMLGSREIRNRPDPEINFRVSWVS
jgi:hypothetical protein